ncbi:hypothetical protein BDU57DRAFT_338622 [Ampelomyces quisqualis]|uniref:Uncharacterized protein n=1 Tax=Ampelomyces quisqualis TaxID=50730 RepID=A0A6A5QDL9_AMPQU|nr:hypothetical protein BDU57DRAFT_338622 [Ampelomyces quisqualis]
MSLACLAGLFMRDVESRMSRTAAGSGSGRMEPGMPFRSNFSHFHPLSLISVRARLLLALKSVFYRMCPGNEKPEQGIASPNTGLDPAEPGVQSLPVITRDNEMHTRNDRLYRTTILCPCKRKKSLVMISKLTCRR